MYQQIKKLIVHYTTGNVTKVKEVTDRAEIEKMMDMKMKLKNPKLLNIKVVK